MERKLTPEKKSKFANILTNCYVNAGIFREVSNSPVLVSQWDQSTAWEERGEGGTDAVELPGALQAFSLVWHLSSIFAPPPPPTSPK